MDDESLRRIAASGAPDSRDAGGVADEQDATAPPEAPSPDAVLTEAMPRADWSRLRAMPWGIPLEAWPQHGITPLVVRRGESRHPVLFVEAGQRRYALKETSPRSATHESAVIEELRRRHCRTLEPVGYVIVRGAPVVAGEIAGRTAYTSGDVGYCITRLAERVLPQSLLYRYPFTDANKRLLWSAVAELMLDLHESGVFWGDPSLANILMDLGDHRLTAVMADAETAELVDGPITESRRQQDLDTFVELLEWQAEDIRLARGLPEEYRLVTQGDAEYFLARYDGLRQEREQAPHGAGDLFARIMDVEGRIKRLNALGYGVLHLGAQMMRASIEGVESAVAPAADGMRLRSAILRPEWYVRQLRTLLDARVPRAYAQRIYEHILVHKWLLSEQAQADIGLEAAARDWVARYHLPALTFLAAYLPGADTRTLYAEYLNILDHTWQMSLREKRPIPLEEGAVDYALAHTPAAPFGVPQE
jgi:hypothetical protein